jgi:lysylphosphatidylglycerol synthetase-like protein (DUF2156 family)
MAEMDRRHSRFAYATGLALLAAIQAVIFSLPLSFAYGMSSGSRIPKDEFSGIAVFGTMLVAGAITAAAVLVIAFAVVMVIYTPGSPFYPRAARALLSSIGCGIAALGTAFVVGGGQPWAVAISVLAFVVAIVYLMQRRSGEIDESV